MNSAAMPARLSRESEFLSRYDDLLRWALRLTQADRSLAEDVVHDAYVQFILSRTDHSSINNLDHYLQQVVRNAHRTHLRQTTPRRFEQLSELDLDAMEISTRNSHEAVHARQMLLAICYYACEQKEVSIAVSVLVLRFIHGYYPNEVAKLTHRTRGAVDGFLRSARTALKVHIDELRPYYFRNPDGDLQASLWNDVTDVFGLQKILFASRKGICFKVGQLEAIYTKPAAKLSRRQISHLVSCPSCLDEANSVLGIVSLRERSSIDVLGKIPKTFNLLFSLAWLASMFCYYALMLPDIDDCLDL